MNLVGYFYETFHDAQNLFQLCIVAQK